EHRRRLLQMHRQGSRPILRVRAGLGAGVPRLVFQGSAATERAGDSASHRPLHPNCAAMPHDGRARAQNQPPHHPHPPLSHPSSDLTPLRFTSSRFTFSRLHVFTFHPLTPPAPPAPRSPPKSPAPAPTPDRPGVTADSPPASRRAFPYPSRCSCPPSG